MFEIRTPGMARGQKMIRRFASGDSGLRQQISLPQRPGHHRHRDLSQSTAPPGTRQCCEAHENPLPDFFWAHTPRRDLSILQTSPNRSQVTTGSFVVPAGLSVDERVPQLNRTTVTNAMRTMDRP